MIFAKKLPKHSSIGNNIIKVELDKVLLRGGDKINNFAEILPSHFFSLEESVISHIAKLSIPA